MAVSLYNFSLSGLAYSFILPTSRHRLRSDRLETGAKQLWVTIEILVEVTIIILYH